MPRPKRTKAPAAQSSAIEALKKRKEAAAAARVPPTPQRAPPSAVKAQSTPGPAAETSVLALANFKRRPRQPSILRMVQQTSDNAAPDDDTTRDTLDDSLNNTLDDTLADFNPEDESTPVQKRRSTRLSNATGEEPRTSSSRKRKFAEPEPAPEQEGEQDEDVQIPRSSPPVVDLSHNAESARENERESSSEHLYSEASDLPTTQVPQTQEEQPDVAARQTARTPSPEVWSSTMAPPMSSSPIPDLPTHSSEPTPKSKVRRRPARGRANGTHDDDDQAPEAAARTTKAKKKTTRQQALTTATLQSLLPRRRRGARNKEHDVFDIPSSDSINAMALDEDEDELQHAPSRKSKTGATSRRTTVATKTPVTATAKRKQQQAKEKAAAATDKPSKTYGRRSSDKENQTRDEDEDGEECSSDEEDNTELTTKRAADKKSAELAAMAKKFAEVDEWEMEFESVDMGGQSASSPWR